MEALRTRNKYLERREADDVDYDLILQQWKFNSFSFGGTVYKWMFLHIETVSKNTRKSFDRNDHHCIYRMVLQEFWTFKRLFLPFQKLKKRFWSGESISRFQIVWYYSFCVMHMNTPICEVLLDAFPDVVQNADHSVRFRDLFGFWAKLRRISQIFW